MKIITWNVNSIRVRLPRLLALLRRHAPDLLCLQETKVTDDAFPHAALADSGYQAVTHGQKTYNGMAFLAREKLHGVERGFPGDPAAGEARVLSADFRGLRVVNAYVVNGKEVGDPKYELKLAWLDAFAAWLGRAHRPTDQLLVAGDFNVAPEDRDVHDPNKWRGHVLFSEPERERLRTLFSWGLQDLLRLHTQEAGIHTWWDYRMGAFARGWGLRIDLALGTAPVAARCSSVTVDRDERKKQKSSENVEEPSAPSDHAPVIVTLED